MAGDFNNSHVQWIWCEIDGIIVGLFTDVVTGEIPQSESLPDSRGNAFDQGRTKTSASAASRDRVSNAECLLHNKRSVLADCNLPKCGQEHSDDAHEALNVGRRTLKNTAGEKSPPNEQRDRLASRG
jgi:hypothetical protein